MSSRDLFEEGDTGEAILPARCGAWGGCILPPGHNRGRADLPENHHYGRALPKAPKVNGKGACREAAPAEGVHADRDRSEAPPEATPPAGNPLHGTPAAEGAAATIADRHKVLRALTDRQRHLMLCFILGYNREAFECALENVSES